MNTSPRFLTCPVVTTRPMRRPSPHATRFLLCDTWGQAHAEVEALQASYAYAMTADAIDATETGGWIKLERKSSIAFFRPRGARTIVVCVGPNARADYARAAYAALTA